MYENYFRTHLEGKNEASFDPHSTVTNLRAAPAEG